MTDIALPWDKLSLDLIKQEEGQSSPERKKRTYVVLVSTGSFNPPTYMHLRCFELARDALTSEGFCVIGGYMSPVNDAYKKKGLISAEHRVAMCQLACKSSEFVMTDPWEASQDSYQRTLTVLSRIKSAICGGSCHPVTHGHACVWSDLLESFSTPGVWIPEQVRTICRDFGLVCVRRGGQDVEKIIAGDDILNEYKKNIKVVDEVVPNGISSTGLRDCISKGFSVKYLTADEVIDYMKQHNLYRGQCSNN
ncbi:nicotinamide/nicotinic acid mononucleotide adenylyltransferase-like [Nicotiana tabacum]|uniref:Nicotinamide-nucleotide adenylyltransferase n=1 Tax=Nicotiana tabacum TaxID=4097 RepID=W6ANL0_TOBAC|nr:nicotinamide/nicotinic acid mononucleotide adenylyltransferase-like [Nicotiana tabacum]AHI58946.1 nicotinamide mononucleotide adenylyltransferase 1 [Nicotiana tabacum]